MQTFLYETHMHTAPASACSDTNGHDFIRRYLDFGYSGIIITDHFWHGNCGIDRSLPWTEFVNRFCSGYEDALDAGIRLGLPVFFGWEETFDGDDYLVYGLSKEWLLQHPEVRNWDRKTQYEQVHAAGGCVVQAHPFRAASYISAIHLSPFLADGIEGFNAGNQLRWNISGMRYARLRNLPITAGSDNHHADCMSRSCLSGVLLNRPLTCIRDYVSVIRNAEPHALQLPCSLPEWTEDIVPELPVYWHDAAGKGTRIDAVALLRSGLPSA